MFKATTVNNEQRIISDRGEDSYLWIMKYTEQTRK